MMPNLSARNRAVRMFAAAVIWVGAALWPTAADLLGLLGVMTFTTGLVGWCPLHEWWVARPGSRGSWRLSRLRSFLPLRAR